MINRILNSIRYNKTVNIKGVLFVFLFNILPIFFVFIGLVYNNVLKIRTKDINLRIDEELQERTVLEKQLILNDLEKEILKYIDENSDYNTKIIELDTNINEITNNIEERKKRIKEKENLNKELEETNNSLNIEYKEISNYEIQNIITINQYPLYPTGCEAVALTILLKYYNVDVTVQDVVNALPKGERPHYENGILYGGNPNYEFLGDPTKYNGWGIWDQGLALTANKFKSSIINGTGMEFQQIIKLVKNNRPVIVWTSINLKKPYISKTWLYKSTGEIITWKNYNHAVVVIGYTEDFIVISDPINGKKRNMDRQKFIDVYNYMGKRAIYY